MEHIAPILTASASVLAIIGGGIGFMWKQISKKFEKIEEELEKCRESEKLGIERRGLLSSIIEVLFSEVMRLHPKSKALKRHDELLNKYRNLAETNARDI